MLRVGSVPYLVARPLDLGLEDEPGIRLEHAVPAVLVERLRASELDVALVSSIELFRAPGYGYLDGLAVAGDGPVSSVQVFLRRPVAAVRSVALDPASRTAAVLTRIVWPSSPAPDFLEVQPGADPREAGADAWLRIGDRALVETASAAPADPAPFNPALAWRTLTGLPFPFAVWVVRPGVDPSPHREAFLRARARGRAALSELARGGARDLGLPLRFVHDYLARECLYEPGERLRPALLAFRDRASRLGQCSGELDPGALLGAGNASPVWKTRRGIDL
jgi:predicted solute-binding protein